MALIILTPEFRGCLIMLTWIGLFIVAGGFFSADDGFGMVCSGYGASLARDVSSVELLRSRV